MEELKRIFFVGLGGSLGSIGRYLLGGVVQGALPSARIPLGTLVINVLGCFAIGLLGALAGQRQVLGVDARLFVFVGVLGGFTTFSSFASETLALARDADLLGACANVALQTVLGLGAAWLGYALVRP